MRLAPLRPALLAVAVSLSLGSLPIAAAPGDWIVVANLADSAPGSAPTATFDAFTPPALNDAGVLVFRASSRSAPDGASLDGLYKVDPFAGQPLTKLIAVGDAVPGPNNAVYGGAPAQILFLPSTPRIDPLSELVAIRAEHQAVWTYVRNGELASVGTSSVLSFDGATQGVAASLLGDVLEPDLITLSFPWASVPETLSGTRFDRFRGAPALGDNRHVVFRGNYTDVENGLQKIGIFYREVTAPDPQPSTGIIVSSSTLIPDGAPGDTLTFGAMSPPSGAGGSVFFTAYDRLESPSAGGIYRAPIESRPLLQTVAAIGDQVPGEISGNRFSDFGETLSVTSEGENVAFWASWGTEQLQKTVFCPEQGEAELIAYCLSLHPKGFFVYPSANQGIFVHNAVTGNTREVARTRREGLQDFVFWEFSGTVPGPGGVIDPDAEPARWRSSVYLALSSVGSTTSNIAFRAERAGTEGIFLRERVGMGLTLQTVIEVGVTPGFDVDPEAPLGSLVTSIGMERDGFRNGRIAISATMRSFDPPNRGEVPFWAGVYASSVGIVSIFADGFE